MIDAIESVVKTELPVDENLTIQKHRLMPETGNSAEYEKEKKRIAIVTGIHGDELEGQYVCYELTRRIRQHALSGLIILQGVFRRLTWT